MDINDPKKDRWETEQAKQGDYGSHFQDFVVRIAEELYFYDKKERLIKELIDYRNGLHVSAIFQRIFDHQDEVLLYEGGWGHMEDGEGCWSALVLTRHCELLYRYGNGPRYIQDLSIDESTAHILTHDYIKDVCRHLSTNKFHEGMKRRRDSLESKLEDETREDIEQGKEVS